jgi:methylphosphotriester-DNA--protein-cysteine methyltransferase
VSAVLRGRETDLCRRSIERRVRRATGLTLGAIRQIERARKAAEFLDRGATILDAGMRAGYADQAHLTRSLKRFMGQTPAQIAKEAV